MALLHGLDLKQASLIQESWHPSPSRKNPRPPWRHCRAETRQPLWLGSGVFESVLLVIIGIFKTAAINYDGKIGDSNIFGTTKVLGVLR